MPRQPIRTKILKANRRTRHRYDLYRLLCQVVSSGILIGVPLSGLSRVDLWGGEHLLLFRPATFKHALAGVILAISALYVVTFLSNVAGGRIFCGWGCPVGQLSRLGEILDTPRLASARRVAVYLGGAAFSLLLAVAFFSWWVDLRVFWRGSRTAVLTAWGLALLFLALAYLHGRTWQWRFCISACPIGLYYSFVSPAHWYGVYFRNEQKSCIECDACDNVCPVDLKPRELMTPIAARTGIAIADAPGRNHCLECGDCVRACEWMIERAGAGTVPLLLGYHRGPQRIN